MESNTHILVKELIQNFSSTAMSLADDSQAIRSLAAVGAAAATANAVIANHHHHHHHHQQQQQQPRGNENAHPNEPPQPNDQSNDPSAKVTNNLRSIERTVAALEEQMAMLKDVVREEKRAMRQLEATKAAAERQSAIIEQMLQASEDIRHRYGREEAGDTNDVDSGSILATSTSTGCTEERSNYQPNKHNNNESQKGGIHLDPVTESELNSVCRNIRGRIPLAWVNDALVDIESVARKKYAVLNKYHKTGLGKLTLGNDYKRRLSMSRRHQNYLNMHYDVEVKDHKGQYWVSEQDLRDSCAFFAKESTARAILLVLRNLKRLKQVYGRRSTVTYILLASSEN